MKQKGIGIGCMWYGIGNTGLPNPASAFVEVHSDCSATVLTGCADIGQGSDTTMAQIVAETLGLNFENIFVTSADTGVTPESGATSASRQTYISGNACKKAAEMARDTLLEVASQLLNTEKDKINLESGQAIDTSTKNSVKITEIMAECKKQGILVIGSGSFNPETVPLDPETMEGSPYATYAFATHVAEVEVNTETGELEINRVIAAHDVGKAVNPKQVESQIEGGCVMGASFAALEELKVKDCKIQNPNYSDYLISTTKDVPEIYPLIVEDPEPTGPYGAKGVGEPALIPTAPAVLNGIYNATGLRLKELPITQEKIIEKKIEEGGN
ncbi:xanthine dehydrogenase family protein molybdopterin-binding subunit [Natranaerobius thermophilus]|uniref:Aldehyde oxidase and xanthine dehydrogenase molybdopterin binding n=1 Tax=Natranaerobius thermophilus (strain ATCC BAA-1301 / DSM 18059 / JW/NM-WN-LF) TaxID=457570 RepID=B2A7K7_NATTJ|nr:molybdopterin cofactor-binding domain-containing protein [Natranaerobius thermophilus]ACB85716.1 aldehyde oxidase and xanthine dehydrogenase molybdopterin binding [Natranaerobius thermophilus JW/NM-WN-LF]